MGLNMGLVVGVQMGKGLCTVLGACTFHVSSAANGAGSCSVRHSQTMQTTNAAAGQTAAQHSSSGLRHCWNRPAAAAAVPHSSAQPCNSAPAASIVHCIECNTGDREATSPVWQTVVCLRLLCSLHMAELPHCPILGLSTVILAEVCTQAAVQQAAEVCSVVQQAAYFVGQGPWCTAHPAAASAGDRPPAAFQQAAACSVL